MDKRHWVLIGIIVILIIINIITLTSGIGYAVYQESKWQSVLSIKDFEAEKHYYMGMYRFCMRVPTVTANHCHTILQTEYNLDSYYWEPMDSFDYGRVKATKNKEKQDG